MGEYQEPKEAMLEMMAHWQKLYQIGEVFEKQARAKIARQSTSQCRISNSSGVLVHCSEGGWSLADIRTAFLQLGEDDVTVFKDGTHVYIYFAIGANNIKCEIEIRPVE